MQPIDTLLSAHWLIPVQPETSILHDHALAIHGGRIVDVLPQAAAATKYRAAAAHHYPTHALIPGLVNAHTHAAMTLMRGIADDLPLMDWLNGHIWPAEKQWVNARFVRDGTDLAMAEMLRGGTTCFNDMYFFPEVTAQAVRQCGMRASVGMIVIDFPSTWADNAQEYLEKGLALHDELRGDPLVRAHFAPHAPYTVSDEILRRIRMLADQLDLSVHMHLHETRDEVQKGVADQGVRPLARLDQLGLLTPSLAAVHMTQLTDREIDRIAASGTRIVHCPESNLKLASGFCPVARLDASGIVVALGTDGAASNNDLDMFAEMRVAALLAKAVANDCTAIPAHRALRMATLHGAMALGMEADIGSLTPGKWADIVAVDLGVPESEPVYNPVSQLVYATGRQQVTDVWVAGKPLVQNRQLLPLDLEDVVRRARRWRDRIGQAP